MEVGGDASLTVGCVGRGIAHDARRAAPLQCFFHDMAGVWNRAGLSQIDDLLSLPPCPLALGEHLEG